MGKVRSCMLGIRHGSQLPLTTQVFVVLCGVLEI